MLSQSAIAMRLRVAGTDRFGKTDLGKPKEPGSGPPGPLHLAAAAAGEAAETRLRELLAAAEEAMEAKAKFGWTPLHFAARACNAAAARQLVDAGADVNARDNLGSTPLHRAACHGSAEVVELLVDAGAELEARDKQGQTALHVAAGNGRGAAVSVLIKRGASQTAGDGPLHDGDTPHDVALQAGETEVAEYLHARQLKMVRLAGGATRFVLNMGDES